MANDSLVLLDKGTWSLIILSLEAVNKKCVWVNDEQACGIYGRTWVTS